MARQKPKTPVRSRVSRPIAFQDATALEQLIQQMIDVSIANVDARVTVLEEQIARIGSAAVRTMDLALPAKPCGRAVVAGVFAAAEIGAPMIIVQGPAQPIDDSEFGILSLVGRVLSVDDLEIVWASTRIPPKSLRIHYIIGTLEA